MSANPMANSAMVSNILAVRRSGNAMYLRGSELRLPLRKPLGLSTVVGSLFDVLQPIAGCAGQSSPAHDHVNRHPCHQVCEAPLACKRLHETLPLHCRPDVRGDAA